MTTSTPNGLPVSIMEMSRTLGVARGTVYQAIKKNQIPHLHISNRLIVPRGQWVAFMKGHFIGTEEVLVEQYTTFSNDKTSQIEYESSLAILIKNKK